MTTKFLIIRVDGIGDLICVTPTLAALRAHYPDARIDVLVNEYNGNILARNPDIDHVYFDWRTRDRVSDRRHPLKALRGWWQRIRLHMAGYDWVFVAHFGEHARALKLAHAIGGKHIVQSVEPERLTELPPNTINLPVTWDRHEVTGTFSMLEPLGIRGEAGPLKVFPAPVQMNLIAAEFTHFRELHAVNRVVGINISASHNRKRWQASHFADWMAAIYARQPDTGFALFWIGKESHGDCAGDDEAAALIRASIGALPLLPVPTATLDDLTAGIACCDTFVSCDGGPMHMACGLGKPVLALFENRQKILRRWYPWRVPNRVVHQLGSETDVAGITVEQMIDAWESLVNELAEIHKIT